MKTLRLIATTLFALSMAATSCDNGEEGKSLTKDDAASEKRIATIIYRRDLIDEWGYEMDSVNYHYDPQGKVISYADKFVCCDEEETNLSCGSSPLTFSRRRNSPCASSKRASTGAGA